MTALDQKINAARLWRLLLIAARADATVAALGPDGTATDLSTAALRRDGDGWCVNRTAGYRYSATAARLLALYLPFCGRRNGRCYVLAHLGQSLDGRIATQNGMSTYINGPANIRHLHRLRALADAVVVGASTAHNDNPRLTTRLVDGTSPLRVVLDPRGRLDPSLGLFTDGAAPTLRVCVDGVLPPGDSVLAVAGDADGNGLSLPALLGALHQRGLQRLFIEGGGVTVSRFLAAGLLDRLHVTVAPVLIGSGRQGVDLAPISDLGDALRPPARRYPMGSDVLFDLRLRDL